MIRKKYNNEQIIVVLKEAEASTNSLTQINFRGWILITKSDPIYSLIIIDMG
jgi:hypothetical protein